MTGKVRFLGDLETCTQENVYKENACSIFWPFLNLEVVCIKLVVYTGSLGDRSFWENRKPFNVFKFFVEMFITM